MLWRGGSDGEGNMSSRLMKMVGDDTCLLPALVAVRGTVCVPNAVSSLEWEL